MSDAPGCEADARAAHAAMAEAREQFLALVADVRPELHRYCARMAGSVFDGEDIVQDTLAKAYFAFGEWAEPPPLRPWLFRIAHHTAMDFLRRYEKRHVDLVAEVPEVVPERDDGPDPERVEAAIATFAALPPVQRSALVLKDVLGHSLEQVAATMGTTVPGVKAALVRARAHVATRAEPDVMLGSLAADERERMQRYADRFNARDWDGLRALLGTEARLDLVSRSQRRGAGTAVYFTRYAEITATEPLRAVPGVVDGLAVIAMFRGAEARPSYFVRLEWDAGAIACIHDFHYVTYIARDARFTPG
jgi:RNA polymerase sigma factor (sigma-70 family)